MTYEVYALIGALVLSLGWNLWLLWDVSEFRHDWYDDLAELDKRHEQQIRNRDRQIAQLRARLPVHGEHGRFVRKDGHFDGA